MAEYSIVPVRAADSASVVDYLRSSFFMDEPLNRCCRLVEGPHDRCMELEDHVVTSIPEGTSVMAVRRDGSILGVCLNGTLTRAEHSDPGDDEVDACGHAKFREILRLLKWVYKEVDTFRRFPAVDKVLELQIMSVDEKWRQRGIGKALVKRTIEIAQERGIPLLRVDCTSAYSAALVTRLGFQEVNRLPYEKYLTQGANGGPVFVPEPPHSAVVSFYLEVGYRKQ